jgi:hypothetical protein
VADLQSAVVLTSVMGPPLDASQDQGVADDNVEVVPPHEKNASLQIADDSWGAIHQLLSIILKLRILVLLPVSIMPYVVKVKNYS